MLPRPILARVLGVRAGTAVVIAIAVLPATAHAAVPGPNGRIAFSTFGEQLVTMSPDGTGATPLTNGRDPSWAPDGTRLAFARLDGDIHVVGLTAGSAEIDLTDDGHAADDSQPAWSPDGSQIAFVRDGDIYTVDAGGRSPPVPRFDEPGISERDPAWSPDGLRLAYSRAAGFGSEIYVSVAGAASTPLVTSFGGDWAPAWSPDGGSIAFTSDRDGDWEVYVAGADGTGQRNVSRTPSAADSEPVWSPDRARLAFLSDREEATQLFTSAPDGTAVAHLPYPANVVGPDWGRGAAPAAAFSMSPTSPLTGDAVTFDAAASEDPDGTVASFAWDLDGDGGFETGPSTAAIATAAYPTAGTRTIRLRVVDHEGNAAEALATLSVRNRPPSASFRVFPNPAFTRKTVRFDASTSADADGRIATFSWDLDGNGSFETGTGATPIVSRRYSRARRVHVRLRVTDDRGADGVSGATAVRVLRRVISARSALIFRNAEGGIRVRSLVLRGVPRRARVELRCTGDRPPACRREVLRARTSTVKSRRLRGRTLLAGAVVEVRVTKPHYIGKYVRFEVLAQRYRKVERCLTPGERRPRRTCR